MGNYYKLYYSLISEADLCDQLKNSDWFSYNVYINEKQIIYFSQFTSLKVQNTESIHYINPYTILMSIFVYLDATRN